MRVLAIQTSPNEDGLTASMAKAAMEGAKAAGAETELVHLCTLDIGVCQQCGQSWGKCREEGNCTIEDDLNSVRDKIAAADALVLATPVYFGDVYEVFKCFFDRLRRCQFAGPEERKVEGRWILSIAAAGGRGGGGPTCLVSMERYYSHMGMRSFDQLIATRRSREYMLKAARGAGEALVRYVEEQKQSG
jgi:multimeric flavodoxin WrbA